MAEQTRVPLEADHVRRLVRDLVSTEALLEDALGGGVDAVLDPETGTPLLLQRAQAELRLMLEQLPALVWTFDRELRCTSFRGAGLAALNLSPGQLVGQHLAEAFPDEPARSNVLEAHRRALDGEPGDLILHEAGRVWQVHVEALRSAEGEVTGVIGVALDTTARARAEAELRRMHAELEEIVQDRTRELILANQELAVAGEELRVQNDDLLAVRRELEAERERYRELFDLAPDGYVVTDRAGVIREANRAAAAMLGVDSRLLVGQPLVTHVDRRDRAGWYGHLDALGAGGESSGPWEMHLRPEGREPFCVSVTGAAAAGGNAQRPASLRWLIRDVTARKEAERERESLLIQAQQARQRSEEHAALLDAVISSIADAVILYDAGGKVTRTNAVADDLLGLSREEWSLPLSERIGRSAPLDAGGQVLKPEELPAARALRGETVHGMMLGLPGRETGSAGMRWALASAAPVRDGSGVLRGAVTIFTEITELRRARDELEQRVAERTLDLRNTLEALQVSEERFQELANNIDEGFWLMEIGTGRLLYISPGYEKLWGRPASELYEQPQRVAEALHPEDRDRVVAAWLSHPKEFNQEFRILRPDGGERWVRSQTFPVERRDGSVQRLAGVLADITEQKRAQAAVVQMERLLVAARLAASLAHEINNPLQSAVGCLDLAREALDDGQDPSRFLAVVAHALERARGVVVQLRTLHRQPDMEERRPAEVRALLERLLPLIRRRSEAGGIEVSLDLEENLPPLMLMHDAMGQVFQHVILNALDAMPEGGRLRIEGRRTTEPEGVLIRFADTGVGLPTEVWEHLFEPFQSTKSEGLGLGLFISQNIVHQHGGQITIQAQDCGGTVVGVWLPGS